MELIITEAAKTKIKNSLQSADEQIFLDFEDGDGPFAATGLSCRLDLSFRLIIVPPKYPADGLAVYDETVASPFGPIKLKKSSLQYLDDKTTLTVNDVYQNLQLKGASGILADNIPILRIDKKIAG